MILIVNYFKHEVKKRADEIDAALGINLNNKIIKEIHLLVKSKDIVPVSNSKIRIKEGIDRATYKDFFDYANSIGVNKTVIISNADISFDDSAKMVREYVKYNTCLCLSRHNLIGGKWKLQTRIDSQDVWVFKTPIKEFDNADFHLGTRGCDNRIAAILSEHYKLKNPASKIICKHHHKSEIRSGSNIVPGKKIHVKVE